MITRKKKECKHCHKYDYIYGHNLCTNCYKKELNNNLRISKSSKKNYNKITFKGLKVKIKEADILYSKVIKLKYSISPGIVKCYTCKNIFHYDNIECGHFVGRKNYSTRWLLQNGRPQCFICNNDKRGNLEVYKALLDFDQPGLPEYLLQLSRIPLKLSTSNLDTIIMNLKKELIELET
jgi:hypothetical protein